MIIEISRGEIIAIVVTSVLGILTVLKVNSIFEEGKASRSSSGAPKQVPPAAPAKAPTVAAVPVATSVTSGDQYKSPVNKKNKDPYCSRKREKYLSWDDYFMSLAYLSGRRSKDPNRQVGACIVSSKNVILGIGYNGFPRGCDDDALPWAKMSEDGDELKTKYPYVCHAEMNAISNKNTASVEGEKMYVTLFPCNECAKIMIQAGIREVVYSEDHRQGDPQNVASRRMFGLAQVRLRQHTPHEPVALAFPAPPVPPPDFASA